MKKVLTIAVVALLATATLFAGVNFGGAVDVGYVFNWNNDGDFTAFGYGNDGTDTGESKINLTASDDNGLWSVSFDFIPQYNSAGKANAELTLNLDKVIEASMGNDIPFTWAVGLGFNDNQTGLRAYNNVSGNNLDRIRTQSGSNTTKTVTVDGAEATYSETTKYGYYFNTTVGYEDLVKVNFAYDPVEIKGLVVGALISPIDGVKVSADYMQKAEIRNGVYNVNSVFTDNAFSVAGDVNVGTLAGLDFDLGVSASYLWAEDVAGQIAAVVYGGIDVVSGYVEYSLFMPTENSKSGLAKDSNVNYIEIGADLSVVDNLAIGAYFGSQDIESFEDSWYIGGNFGYDLAGIGLNLNLEYAKGTRFADIGANEGFSITPWISVAF